jgi:hypothetical protein
MTATLLGRPHTFERGDRVYLTTPIRIVTPSQQEVEEFAFASAVKTKAPNENIGWLEGRYVEAGNANLNGAMWLSNELAVKALTPMLMPITVMHDPRTAVGTIADCKLQSETTSRIDTVLAVWRHRFPEVWEEAEANVAAGTMMQSMECYAPWYTCADCNQQYIKLPNGAERASWCDHLRGNGSSPGRRILGDVCFTGTGLIFGTRGGVGAYTEAYLDHFHDEVAEYHERSHAESTYTPNHRSTSQMGLVQIEESELATLRRERDEARVEADTLKNSNRDLTTKAEQAEAAQKVAETAAEAAQKAQKDSEEKAQAATLKSTRLGALGDGFMAKLGETSKTVLGELAGTASDEAWEQAVAEREELVKAKRDAKADGTPAPKDEGASTTANGFQDEEVASFMGRVTAPEASATNNDVNGSTAVRSLARSFAKPKKTAA